MDGQKQDKGRLYAVGKRIMLPEDEALQLEAQRRVVYAPAPKRTARAGKEPAPKDPGPELPLVVNTATAEELAKIDGLNEAKAKAIVERREKEGLFTSIVKTENDAGLTVIKGIGDATAKKLADGVLVAKQPEPLNLNEATAEELEAGISGVGEATAGDIVAHRDDKPFESIEDCADRVGGVSVQQLEAANATV
ncbi:MAG: ComEA family DNA-binding protein [Dichotomicrobium sp.]